MDWKDLLPWLNLLVLPAVYGIVHVTGAIKELLVMVKAHDELDRVRFDEVGRRLANLEKTRAQLR